MPDPAPASFTARPVSLSILVPLKVRFCASHVRLIAHVVALQIYLQPHSPAQDQHAGAAATGILLLKAAKFHLIWGSVICFRSTVPQKLPGCGQEAVAQQVMAGMIEYCGMDSSIETFKWKPSTEWNRSDMSIYILEYSSYWHASVGIRAP